MKRFYEYLIEKLVSNRSQGHEYWVDETGSDAEPKFVKDQKFIDFVKAKEDFSIYYEGDIKKVVASITYASKKGESTTTGNLAQIIKWSDEKKLHQALYDDKQNGYLVMDISNLNEDDLNKIKEVLKRRAGEIPLIFVSNNKKFAVTKKLYNY